MARTSPSQLNGQRWLLLALSCGILAAGQVMGQAIAQGTPAATAADYRQRGLAYRQAGDLPAAIAAFQEAVALAPDLVSGRVLLGWTQHLAGESDAALVTLRETGYLDPLAVETWNALGIVYLVRGELPEAVLVHTWAAMLKPDNEIAYYNLSLAYQRLGRYDWAIATGTQATEIEPQNPHPWLALAIAHWSNGEPLLAREAYQAAIAVDGRYGDPATLDYLSVAAFSAAQIALVEQVQRATAATP
jgi:tetratricopeptide (TPR) repeat protein